jgi:hypothetical protein
MTRIKINCKKIIIFLTPFFYQSRLAQALPFEWGIYHAAEGNAAQPSASLFTLNPAATISKGASFGLAETIQVHEIELEEVRDTANTKGKVNKLNLRHAAGLMFSGGGGLNFGFHGRLYNDSLYGNYENGGQYSFLKNEERLQRKEGSAKIVMEFNKNLRIAAMFRYQNIRSDLIGSVFVAPEDRSNYKGSLYGGNVGAQFAFDAGGIGAVYVMPLRGKVKISGESKVTTSAGMVLLNGYYDPIKELRLGVSYSKVLNEKDELAVLTSGPNPQNNAQISLLGISPERRFYYTHILGLGGNVKLGSDIGVKTTLFIEEGEYLLANDTLPGEKDNERNKSRNYRGRVSFGLVEKSFDVQVGLDYSIRKKDVDLSENNDFLNKVSSQEVNSFVSLSLLL